MLLLLRALEAVIRNPRLLTFCLAQLDALTAHVVSVTMMAMQLHFVLTVPSVGIATNLAMCLHVVVYVVVVRSVPLVQYLAKTVEPVNVESTTTMALPQREAAIALQDDIRVPFRQQNASACVIQTSSRLLVLIPSIDARAANLARISKCPDVRTIHTVSLLPAELTVHRYWPLVVHHGLISLTVWRA